MGWGKRKHRMEEQKEVGCGWGSGLSGGREGNEEVGVKKGEDSR